ncbi:MAG TPA: SUF system NifU family Fe-S cluster assembly protein, partial [Acidimicrobiia bacterium]|nr:SUF system NifU family Fe-S cluster assembly protein [Acidimicrobiia bacterium]
MSVEEIYREVILDHYRNPRHRGTLEGADAHAEGSNPLCGDEVLIDAKLDDGRIADVAVSGSGCAISQASASMMT